MHKFILTMIVVVTCTPYVVSQGWLPTTLDYLPEVLSLIVCVVVIVRGVESRFQHVRPMYWLIFGGLIVGVICGVLVNQLAPGPMFAGLRNYLRALPFFFLPAVFLIDEQQLRTQLKVLLGIGLLQLPLAWSQRMGTIAAGAITGDRTFGTLMGSGTLSLFLIAAACILTGFYLRGSLTFRDYLLILICIVLPTTFNETKITFILLPVALLTTLYIGSTSGNRFKNTLLGLAITSGFLAAAIPIYDHFMEPRWGYGLFDFVTMEGRLEGYLMKGTEIGDQQSAGRVDAIFAAFAELSKDPAKMLFGLGVGNASASALGPSFEGEYHGLFEYFPLTSILIITLELGLLGLMLVLALIWQVLRDCVALLTSQSGIFGALAAGWAGVTVTVFFGLLYGSPIASVAISYLYWYFSGVLVARRMYVVARAA